MSDHPAAIAWRVTAIGVNGTEFTYWVEADTERIAIEEAYAQHGRKYKEAQVNEFLGERAYAQRISDTNP